MVHVLIAHTIDGDLPDIPPQLMVDMHISSSEENEMGIGCEWTDKWRAENQVPNSDGIEEALGEIASIQKRGRALSTIEEERRTRRRQ